MSYFTQSGSWRSDRIAGNPPSSQNFPTNNTVAQPTNTFSPYDNSQASVDGVSYDTSVELNSNTNEQNSLQDNIALLQQLCTESKAHNINIINSMQKMHTENTDKNKYSKSCTPPHRTLLWRSKFI